MTMLTADDLAAMRDTVNAALPDTCTITGEDPEAGPPELDTDTGLYAASEPLTLYSGACRLRRGATGVTAGDDRDQGGAVKYVEQWLLTLPAEAAVVAVGSVVSIDSGSDPTISVRRFRIVLIPPGSWLLSRQVIIEEVVDGG